MAHPFDPASPSRRDCLQLLIAPCGSLSADGQLRELIRERRRHAALGEGGEDGGGLWFLPEGLVTQASRTAIWLQLRFGGQLQTINLPSDWLCAKAMALPPSAPEAPVGAAAAGRSV